MTRRVAALVTLALLAAACGSEDAAPPLVTTTVPAEPAPEEIERPPASIRQVECPAEIERDGVACGLVDVLRDPTDSRPDRVTISVATLVGTDAGFRTPMAVLQGGPGGASTDFAGWLPPQAYTQVFIDQRGTGFGGVDADCPEFDEVIPATLEALAAEAAALSQNALAQCAARVERNAPLHDLLGEATTQNHASDVGQVMTALGYDRWVAYGVSYGSTIGFELLRRAPAGLVGVVLDGVYPPDLDVDAGVSLSAETSIAALGEACRRSAACADVGEVEATLAALIVELDAAPRTVSLSANEAGLDRGLDVVLDGTRLAEFVFFLLYSESLARFLPAVLDGIARDDTESERWLARVGSRVIVSAYGANDEATFFSVQCHDRLPFTDPEAEPIGAFGSAMSSTPLRESCAVWNRDAAPEEAGSAVISNLPTLLLSGAFDPITPPAYAEQAAASLDFATKVTQAGRGHGIWIGDDCIGSIVEAFVADPARRLNTDCAEIGVPVDWARP